MLLSSLAACANTLDKHYSFVDAPITKRWIVVKDGKLKTSRGLFHPLACFAGSRYLICDRIYELAKNTLSHVNQLTQQQRKGLIWLKTQAVAWHHDDLEELCESVVHRCDHIRMNQSDDETKEYLLEEIDKVRKMVLEPLQARFCDDLSFVSYEHLLQAERPEILGLHDRIAFFAKAVERGDEALATRLEKTLVTAARNLDIALKLAPHLEGIEGALYDKVIDTLYIGRLGLSRKEFELIPESMQREIRSRKSETLSVWKRLNGPWMGATGSNQATMLSLKDEGVDLFYVPPAWGGRNTHVVSNGHRDFRLNLIEDTYLPEGLLSVAYYADKLPSRYTQTGAALARLRSVFSSSETHTYAQQRRWQQLVCDTLFAGRDVRALSSQLHELDPTQQFQLFFAEDGEDFKKTVDQIGVWFRRHQADQLRADLRIKEGVLCEKIEKLRWAAIVPPQSQ